MPKTRTIKRKEIMDALHVATGRGGDITTILSRLTWTDLDDLVAQLREGEGALRSELIVLLEPKGRVRTVLEGRRRAP